MQSSDPAESRSSTSGCFSSMTDSTSPSHQQPLQREHAQKMVPSYQLRLIDDTTSNDYVDDYEDNHSDLVERSSK